MFWYDRGKAYHKGLQSSWSHGKASHTTGLGALIYLGACPCIPYQFQGKRYGSDLALYKFDIK